MMQWIASTWAPVIYIFEFAQTEQDVSDPCVLNVRASNPAEPLQLRNCNTRKRYIQNFLAI